MSAKIEGTLLVGGIIEGRLPDRPDAESRLREWANGSTCRLLGMRLDFRGENFSALATAKSLRADELGSDPAAAIARMLRELAAVYPGTPAGAFSSTLRTAQYLSGQELQSLYLMRGDGQVDVRQRGVAAETTPPPRPLTKRQKWTAGLGVAAAALALIGISALFVDYPRLFGGLGHALSPLQIARIEVDAAPFAKYLTVEKKGFERQELILALKRADRYPLAADDYMRQSSAVGDNVVNRLVIESLARGYIRVELFDEEGKYRATSELRVKELAQKEAIELAIPLPRDFRLGKLALVP